MSSVFISFLSGIDGAVPGRVTEMLAVAHAKRSALSIGISSANATASPPLKASPAPVVSTIGPT